MGGRGHYDLRNASHSGRRELQLDQEMPSDTGATRFVSLAILIMLIGLVSAVYFNS